eukprot:8536117-Prorocentrum_lima.AAC.1
MWTCPWFLGESMRGRRRWTSSSAKVARSPCSEAIAHQQTGPNHRATFRRCRWRPEGRDGKMRA